MMQAKLNMEVLLSRMGLGLIFVYCLLASIFCALFAQIHLRLPSVNFPIFIGEIFLLICLIILGSLCAIKNPFDRRSLILLGLYFGWVLIKASINYYYDGPLTCRNAALFYYPIFAVFSYCFYRKAQIPQQVLTVLSCLVLFVLVFKLMGVWSWWTYVTFLLIAVCKSKSFFQRFLGVLFLVFIFYFGKEYLYKGPRAHFVSVFGAVAFLVFYLGALLAKRRRHGQLFVMSALFICFILGFFIFADRRDIFSVMSIKGMINSYQDYDRMYQQKRVGYKPENLTVRLYNPKKFGGEPSLVTPENSTALTAVRSESSAGVSATPVPSSVVPISEVKKSSLPKWIENILDFIFPSKKSFLNNMIQTRIREGRSLDVNEANIIFRLFVWRDMARELIKDKAWWGFSFGHPQRSESLEVLSWAESEWSRDGWITPHNSFFHVIYRAGLLGLVFIGFLMYMIVSLIKDFFKMNSIVGGFLMGALIYWMILSNFFVILEFPYNAIIIWSLFGITWALREKLKKERSSQKAGVIDG